MTDIKPVSNWATDFDVFDEKYVSDPYSIWAVLRDETINRSYLGFALLDKVTRALMARLRRSADGLRSQLNLYFASGMEMRFDCP